MIPPEFRARLTERAAADKVCRVGETQERVRYDLWAPRPPAEGPIEPRTIFGEGDGPFELDIGFGRGASIFERARNAPNARILGVEVKTKCAHQVFERCQREGLSGVRVYATDVRTLLPRITPDAVISRVSVHFPDPWWKKRHAHRMVVGDVLLDELARLFVPGGDLFVQTDVEERANEYLEAIRAHGAFVLATDSGFVNENPFGARSNRERRAVEDGLPVHRILAHRRGLASQPQSGRCGG